MREVDLCDNQAGLQDQASISLLQPASSSEHLVDGSTAANVMCEPTEPAAKKKARSTTDDVRSVSFFSVPHKLKNQLTTVGQSLMVTISASKTLMIGSVDQKGLPYLCVNKVCYAVLFTSRMR